MSFLTIPSQDNLFTTVKTGKSAEASSGGGEDNNNDEDDDDDEQYDVRLIPRSSPIPRKRGASIHAETVEYLQIRQAFSPGKRVQFADTTGLDLVEVKEFIAFEPDDEEESARWEEEEAKYRKAQRVPTYNLHPEFNAPTTSALLQAVRAHKVEVEQMSPVEEEPLAFTGLIRVLNVSFHKAVYIRSTMDSWATYYDYPAEYVQGSNDGDTDQFSFKLSFAPPYITHGSRIEFVVRYETSDGDFWANNSHMNYVMSLLLSYEDDFVQVDIQRQPSRGILKPPKLYSTDDYFGSDDELENIEENKGIATSGLVRPTAVHPVIVEPEIDIQIAVHPSGPSVPPNHELPSVDDGTPSAHGTVSPGEHFSCLSSQTTTLQTNSSFVLCASQSVQPNKSPPLPRLHCELGNQTSEQQPMHCSPSAPGFPAPPPPLLQPESRPRSDCSQAGPKETPPPCVHIIITETNLEEDGWTDSPCLEPPSPSVTLCSEREDALGLSELVAGLSDCSSSRYHEGNSLPALLWPPMADSQASTLGTEGKAPPAPELAENPSVSTGVTEVSQHSALQSVSAWEEEEEDATQISPDTILENIPETLLSEVSALESEHNVNRILMPAVVFLSGVVSLSVVLQEPSGLFVMGLLLLLHCLSLCHKSL